MVVARLRGAISETYQKTGKFPSKIFLTYQTMNELKTQAKLSFRDKETPMLFAGIPCFLTKMDKEFLLEPTL